MAKSKTLILKIKDKGKGTISFTTKFKKAYLSEKILLPTTSNEKPFADHLVVSCEFIEYSNSNPIKDIFYKELVEFAYSNDSKKFNDAQLLGIKHLIAEYKKIDIKYRSLTLC